MSVLIAGLLFGLAGSMHCSVMCGPLVMTVGGWVDSRQSKLAGMLAYHAGRVLIYLVLAVAAGAAGQALSFGGVGRAVSIVCGVLLVIVAVGSGARLVPRRAGLFWSVTLTRACVAANRSTRTHPVAGQAVAGMFNGLLPCGLLYAAAIAAAGFGSVSAAFLFMAGFGLGTIPVLLIMSLSAASLSFRVRSRLRRFTPAALVLTGTLLIARGLMPLQHHSPRHHAADVVHHPR